MELTKEKAIEEHRKMWNWIADETLKRKHKVNKLTYFNENLLSDKVRHNCFLCEYTFQNYFTIVFTRCRSCPLKWTERPKEEYRLHECVFSIYSDWQTCNVENYELAAALAKRIANLPEIEG